MPTLTMARGGSACRYRSMSTHGRAASSSTPTRRSGSSTRNESAQTERIGDSADPAATEPPIAAAGASGAAASVTTADPTAFYVQFDLDSVRAIRQLEEILRNVVEHLSGAADA